MKSDYFLDTNVLLYAVSRNPVHRLKKIKAIDLIETQPFGTSAQVLQEFYVNATRKADYAMPATEALEWIELMEEMPCCPLDATLVKAAVAVATRYRISYWDGAIVAAAEALGTPIIYSEDLNDGQTYGAVRVVNPFKALHSYGGLNEASAEPLK